MVLSALLDFFIMVAGVPEEMSHYHVCHFVFAHVCMPPWHAKVIKKGCE